MARHRGGPSITVSTGGSGSAAPSGAAGGDLTGTYPNPTIAAGAVDLSGTKATGTLAAGRFPALTGDVTTSAGSLATTIANGAVDLSGAKATGILAAARFPALTGDVTTSSGAVATTIANGAVSLAKQANLAANSIQGNNTGSPATPLALTVAQTKTLLAISAAADLSGALAAANFPALTGDVTTSAGALATTIANSAVTNAKMANAAAYTVKGNATSGSAALTDMTSATALGILQDTGYTAADYGLKAMALDPAACGNGSTPLTPAGTIFGTRIRIPYAMTITQLIVQVVTAGGTLTSGQCFAAIYQGNNLLQTTADQSGTWNSTGYKAMTITSQALTAGFADVVFFYNGTTGPAFLRVGGSALAAPNLNLATTAIRFFTADTGRTTTMPGTLGAKSNAPAGLYWAAVN